MLYRDTNGEWKTGALKHGYGWGNYYPLLSPLYRLEKIEFSEKEIPELLKDEKFITDEKELYLLRTYKIHCEKSQDKYTPKKSHFFVYNDLVSGEIV